MSSIALESPLAPSTIDSNDPALTETHHIDPNAVPLQHGLVYDREGHVAIKPEIAADLDPKTLVRAKSLLAATRTSEANSLVACRNIKNVTSYCADGHEAEYGAVVCNKPLLHEPCAVPKSRVAKFASEHPDLYASLLASVIHVLTFTAPQAIRPSESRRLFARFRAELDLEDDSDGWQWLWAYSNEGTVFYAVHAGSCLPGWPKLNALWCRIAGNSATLRVRTFDGHDGDLQRDGLLLANSGFLAYWDAVAKGQVDLLEMSLEMRNEDLTTLTGAFRGFLASDSSVFPDEPVFLPKCLTCGKHHVAAHGMILGTLRELSERFDHIRPMSYGQSRRLRYTVPTTRRPVGPSPPS